MATPTYDFEYIAVLKDSGIEQTPEIKTLIKSANMAKGKYLSKPTTGNLTALTKIDDAIIDAIDKAVEDAFKQPAMPEVVTSTAAAVPEVKTPEPAPETVIEMPAPEPPPAPELSLEDKVRAAIDGNGCISSSDLKLIIGKLNTWDGEEKIGSLKLKKASFQDYYKIAN